MNARVRSSIAKSTYGSTTSYTKDVGMNNGSTAADRMSDEERIAQERALWVRQRQMELETVVDGHDTLIREAFHLEKFVTLLSYNPKTAKEDSSAVFQQFKQRYDLLNQSATPGPSRQTRRAHTARLQSLKATTATPTSPSPRQKGSRVEASKDREETPSVTATGSRSKGKQKVFAAVPDPPDVPSEMKHVKGKGKMRAAHVDISAQPALHHPDQETIAHEIQPPMKKRRRAPSPSSLSTRHARSISATGSSSHMPPPESTSAALPRAAHRKWDPQQRQSLVSAPIAVASTESASPAKSSVKRVKLIVRLPDPVYTNPRQRPPPPKHGQSLQTLLSSYTVLDGEEVDNVAMEKLVRRNIRFWDRVEVLRKQGRWFPPGIGIGDDPNSVLGVTDSDLPALRRSQDPWAHIVEAVKARALHRSVNGRQAAAQVASRVRAYWESRAVKDDKARLQEEKRLRALAKATVKMVVTEWKKAVYHVREEMRLKREEEERKRGHEHLDAILDQSGQILEAQQLDLSKTDPGSRSSSVSATLRRWASVSPTDEVSSTEGEASDEISKTGGHNDDTVGVDSSFLLGDTDRFPLSQESTSMSIEESNSRGASSSYLHEDSSQRDTEDLSTPGEPSEPRDDGPIYTTSPSPLLGSQDLTSVAVHETMRKLGTTHQPSGNAPLSPSVASGEMAYSAENEDREAQVSSDFALASRMAEHFGEPSKPNGVHSNHVTGDTGINLNRDVHVTFEEPEVQMLGPAPYIESMDGQSTLSLSGPAVHAGINHDKEGAGKHIDYQSAISGFVDHADANEEDSLDSDNEDNSTIPMYLRPYAVAPVEWDLHSKINAPFLLRGNLRPYQQAGLEWLASLHTNNLNGILADEMGLGKTIQTIALLAHLACDRGIWGPHLIVVPTSVLLNWEMEFKKFLPGFKVLSYHGTTKRRKELRQGWNNKYHFNRKPWYYMILDEAHMIKNFRSQRWNILLMFRSFRRLLLTGTPLQNNLTELWALLQFLMSGTNFANLKEFGDWFANPLEKAIEMGTLDDETQQRVSKLHMVLRPYLLRRLKRDVEKELPHKYEHLVMCSLSKRQRLLYDEFMARAETRHDLQSGVYHKIANILMQLRKVVNHPDLFEVRPIVTSFVIDRSAVADYEIKEFLIRRHLLCESDEDHLNLDGLGIQFVQRQNTSLLAAIETYRLDGTSRLPMITELPGEPPPRDTRTVQGYRQYRTWQQRASSIANWVHIGYLNRLRCSRMPIYSAEMIFKVQTLYEPLRPITYLSRRSWGSPSLIHTAIKSYVGRAEDMADIIDRFAFVTPAVVARDLPRITLHGAEAVVSEKQRDVEFDVVLHRASVKLQIAFPDPSLLQYDCGKLQELARLLRERKAGGHRILIFTQMTRILDILEIFLNLHGYLYLRLDGATKIEDRQYITERFNSDPKIFCFISSSRSGGVGINLTGADTVIFYDSDFNPQMDRQCEDRAHRIGQIRDVHIYRFISAHTIEEALLRKANQKRSLDDIVIQKGEFDWRSLFPDENALTKAMGECEDSEDAHAAAVAAKEEVALVGADEADFAWEGGPENGPTTARSEETAQETPITDGQSELMDGDVPDEEEEPQEEEEDETEEGGTTVDYMLAVVRSDMEFFGEWRV